MARVPWLPPDDLSSSMSQTGFLTWWLVGQCSQRAALRFKDYQTFAYVLCVCHCPTGCKCKSQSQIRVNGGEHESTASWKHSLGHAAVGQTSSLPYSRDHCGYSLPNHASRMNESLGLLQHFKHSLFKKHLCICIWFSSIHSFFKNSCIYLSQTHLSPAHGIFLPHCRVQVLSYSKGDLVS